MASIKNRKRAYEDTAVSVSRSREQIDKILLHWGVVGIQWEDNFDQGFSQLRFRWSRDEDCHLIARFRIGIESDNDLKENAKDQRSGQFSQKKYDRIKAGRGKREHRVLLNLLKNMFEAIEAGIIPAESILLPWIEDAEGQTVYDKIAPNLHRLTSSPLHKALKSSGNDE